MTGNIKPIRRNINFKKNITVKSFLKFIENREERYELINGQIRLMASPNTNHQRIALKFGRKIGDYLDGRPCEVFIAPLDVVLFKKDKDKFQNVFQPDVFVICNPKKITDKRIYGAPDFVIEIVSPSNSETDYLDKLSVYMKYGVREYWIVNPETRNILVYIKDEKQIKTYSYTFENKIKVGIFDDFEIDFKELNL